MVYLTNVESWRTLLNLLDSGGKLDLGFVVDTTRSIKEENIPKLKEGLSLLIQEFDISEEGTHVSLETFGEDSMLHNKFKDAQYYSAEAVLDLIKESIGELTKPTRLDLAMELADDEMFTHENGHRAGVRSVMVLFTDGRSHPTLTSFKAYMNRVMNLKVGELFI